MSRLLRLVREGETANLPPSEGEETRNYLIRFALEDSTEGCLLLGAISSEAASLQASIIINWLGAPVHRILEARAIPPLLHIELGDGWTVTHLIRGEE